MTKERLKMLDDKQYEIERWIRRLDEVAIEKEAIWGIGFLQSQCDNDIKKKWEEQTIKLENAIKENNAILVSQLVEGSIRGWSVIENNVISKGIKPKNSECLEIKLDSGFHLRIAKSQTQARSMTKEGVYVWSLEEVARVLEKDYTLVNIVKNNFPGAKVTKSEPFDFKKGDDMPF